MSVINRDTTLYSVSRFEARRCRQESALREVMWCAEGKCLGRVWMEVPLGTFAGLRGRARARRHSWALRRRTRPRTGAAHRFGRTTCRVGLCSSRCSCGRTRGIRSSRIGSRRCRSCGRRCGRGSDLRSSRLADPTNGNGHGRGGGQHSVFRNGRQQCDPSDSV